MKNEKGITLIALIVTIIVLILITGAGITAGAKSLNDVRLKAFYTKLEIEQEGIEKIRNTDENYKDDNNNTVYLKNLGTEPTQAQKDLIEQITNSTSTGFRYFTKEQLQQQLQIYGVDLNLLINFDNNIIINPEGIKIGKDHYYMLENKKNIVNKEVNDRNIGTPDYEYDIYRHGSNSYRIVITPINIGDINQGTVKYRKVGLDYWNVAEGNEFIVNEIAQYQVQYIDANNNSITKTLEIIKDPIYQDIWIEEV